MKFILKISLLLFILTLASKAGAQNKKKEIDPKKFLGKVVLKGKGEYTYYALSEKNMTSYTVTGPGVLHVNFRVRLQGNNFESQPFKVKSIRSGAHVEMIQVPQLVAGNLKFKHKNLTGSPTKQHRETIQVPPGKHTYRFYKYHTAQKAHMRAFYEKHTPPKWRTVEPANDMLTKTVKFKKSGKTKEYHVLGKNDPFNFSIDKDSHLRLIVRPEFTYKMLSETVIRIRLTNEKTGVSTIYKLDARKSGMVEFVDDKKNTPGNSSTVYLRLKTPQGIKSTYSLTLLSGAKNAVIRLSNDQNFVSDSTIAGK